MDTTTLTDVLRALNPEEYTWKFAPYRALKSRDGIELEFYLCNMQNIPEQVEGIREYLLNKPVADKPVAPYTPFLSDKESIGALDKSDDQIHERLTGIFMSIKNGHLYPPKDFVSGSMPKVAGYAFYGEPIGDDSEPVLLMRRSNPFLTGARFYAGPDNEIIPTDMPVLKFTAAIDFLVIGSFCYFFSSSIEKDFDFQNRHFAVAQKWLDRLVEAEVIGNYDNFERAVMTSKNARKFLDFDTEVLEYIVGLPIVERAEYLEKYGVETDPGGRMDTYGPEQCSFIIDLLCSRSCLNPLGKLSTGNNITPRE